MLPHRSVKTLYPLALAEGEGVGTAYEYLAKRLVLRPTLAACARRRPIRRILIAGLPEKYGSSLDFLLLAQELGAEAFVIDDRPPAVARWQHSLAAARSLGGLTNCRATAAVVDDWSAVDGRFDLALSSEVLQRLTADAQQAYLAQIGRVALCAALFCPNQDNKSHVGISGLNGLTRAALQQAAPWATTGYIDMPPFPPGITRSEAQREQATSGRLEALAMAGLGVYARLERFWPTAVRRRQSHIVYAVGRPAQAD